MKKRFFVTGTDTDCGKTFISCALLHKANQENLKTIGFKPIAAGATLVDGELKNDDALALMQYSQVQLPYEQINPIVFAEPIAPHIAAEREGKSLSVSRLAGIMRGSFMVPHQFALIEGAGGWLVPLNNREMLSDIASELQTPVILVVGIKLGCINHALLTISALKQKNVPLAGWVANIVDDSAAANAENISSLKRFIAAPCLGEVPFISEQSVETAASYLDITPLISA